MNPLSKVLAFVAILALGTPALTRADEPKPYRFTAGLPGTGSVTCGDWSGPADLFLIVRRNDPVIETEIKAVESEVQNLTGQATISDVRTYVSALNQRRIKSEIQPLTEAERKTLVRLHQEPPEDADGKRKLKELERRVALTPEEASILDAGEELLARRDDLERLILWRSSQRTTMRIFEGDILRVQLMDDDLSDDDLCGLGIVVLDKETLGGEFIVVEDRGRPVAMFRFEPE